MQLSGLQLSGQNIGVVADDMTGANDTALQFFIAGVPTQVLLNCDGISNVQTSSAQALSINTDSRHLDKPTAARQVRQAVQRLRDQFGVENFYKKMDSTLRGHIAEECLAFLDELEADCVVIVPAFPQEGRTTVGGYQLVHGTPVERTFVVRDPLFPVRQSHIPTLLGQQTNPSWVGYIPLSTVLHGAGPIQKELSEHIREGRKLVVMDATSDEDLEQIALVIEKINSTYKVLPCGAAGLAHALTKRWVQDSAHASNDPVAFTPSPILIVSGSISHVTRTQLQQLQEHYALYGHNSKLTVFELTPNLTLGLSSSSHLVAEIQQALGTDNTVILTSALQDGTYSETLALGQEHAINDHKASALAQEVMATLTAQVLETLESKLILCGGETSASVCKALGSQTLKLIAEAQPAIPLTIDDKGHWIITKSGHFGEPMVLANLVQFLKSHQLTSLPS